VGKQNLEKLFLREEHCKRRQVEANGLLVDLPLGHLAISRCKEIIALYIHSGKVLLEVDSDQIEIVIDEFTIVNEGVLNHIDQFFFN
jgi:hypothetical protein